MSWHCTYCGTKEKTNTISGSKTGDFTTICSDCGIQFRFYVITKPTKTIEEADESFNKTELTKQQRTGSGNKPYKKRGRRKKK